MGKQPYIPFYIGDYLKDTRVLPLAVRGAWVDLILFMWDAPVRGELLGTYEDFARLLSCTVQEAEFALNLLEAKKTADISKQGEQIRVCSRRMMKEASISVTRSRAGSDGGNTFIKRRNEPGFLYIMADLDQPRDFKIGVSIDPNKRIYGVRRDTGRQSLRIIWTQAVPDMSVVEDRILAEIGRPTNGWYQFESDPAAINSVSFALSKSQAKSKQTPEYEYEGENEGEIDFKYEYKPEFKNREELRLALFNDKQFTEAIAITHQGKDIQAAFNECYTHHSALPRPPQLLWEWKQKLNTWLTNKSPEKKTNGKQNSNLEHKRDLAESIREKYNGFN